jgi:hypothetical protein
MIPHARVLVQTLWFQIWVYLHSITILLQGCLRSNGLLLNVLKCLCAPGLGKDEYECMVKEDLSSNWLDHLDSAIKHLNDCILPHYSGMYPLLTDQLTWQFTVFDGPSKLGQDLSVATVNGLADQGITSIPYRLAESCRWGFFSMLNWLVKNCNRGTYFWFILRGESIVDRSARPIFNSSCIGGLYLYCTHCTPTGWSDNNLIVHGLAGPELYLSLTSWPVVGYNPVLGLCGTDFIRVNHISSRVIFRRDSEYDNC